VIALAVVIALGLASRRFPGVLFPDALGKYPGDALWALMIFVLAGLVRPAASTRSIALVALAVSYVDELAQLDRAPWLVAVRATTLGHLVLGAAFEWADLVAYTVGVAVGVALEVAIRAAPARARSS
jgi:hypothetical protein